MACGITVVGMDHTYRYRWTGSQIPRLQELPSAVVLEDTRGKPLGSQTAF